jgi:hypothetical protein
VLAFFVVVVERGLQHHARLTHVLDHVVRGTCFLAGADRERLPAGGALLALLGQQRQEQVPILFEVERVVDGGRADYSSVIVSLVLGD